MHVSVTQMKPKINIIVNALYHRMTQLILVLVMVGLVTNGHAETLEQRIIKLEQEIETIKQQLESLQKKPSTAKLPASQSPVSEATAPQLLLKKWSFRKEPRKFDVDYAIDLELLNNFDKAIREIDARIDFKNLLGDHFYSIEVSTNLDIPAGETGIDLGSRQNKRVLGKGHQMLRMSAEDIKAELVIRKIVFEDSTLLRF